MRILYRHSEKWKYQLTKLRLKSSLLSGKDVFFNQMCGVRHTYKVVKTERTPPDQAGHLGQPRRSVDTTRKSAFI